MILSMTPSRTTAYLAISAGADFKPADCGVDSI